MTDRTHDNHNLPAADELDSLLRQWHEENRITAEAGRDQLLARLAAEASARNHQRQADRARAAVVRLALWRIIMHRYTRVAASLFVVVGIIALLFPPVGQQTMAQGCFINLPDGGRLDAFDDKGNHIGPCPLKHTDVDVRITGHFSRVTLRQQYHNPYDTKIEAVYTFPLGHNGAVDRMKMTIGDRVVVGEVKERELARQVYEAARDQGYVASLLEQERPNLFTQSVANIEPGAEVLVEISYVEVLESVDGEHRFVFPMVVAPRYIPGSPLGLGQVEDGTFAPDTDQVPDASRITPMPVKPDMRAGHDISVQVRIETGGPGLLDITTPQHEVDQSDETVRGDNVTGVTLALKNETEIPNRDFILTWRQTGEMIEEATFTHTGDYGDYSGGFFTLILQPPHRVEDEMVRDREIIFVLDNSGSMRGAILNPGQSALDAAKDVINKAIDTMRPNDRFNIISFNHTLDTLWDQPRPNTPDNRAIAQQYVDMRQGGGGTEMANAVFAALGAKQFARDLQVGDDPADDLMRIVLFVTDGLVGNDDAIIRAVRDHAHETRVFTIGMSRSPNRYLLDRMAEVGRGAADYALPGDDVDSIVQRFADRIATPVLTDITLEFSDELEVVDVLPGADRLPDLFDVSPLVIHGRYTQPGVGTLTIRGRTGAGPYERTIELELPEHQDEHDVIATLWARANIERLSIDDEKDAIIALGEQFQIMSRFTSFVAVEMQRKTVDGETVLVRVPIEFPEGMSWEGVFGERQERQLRDDLVAAPGRAGQMVDSLGRRATTAEPSSMPATRSRSQIDARAYSFEGAPQFDLNRALRRDASPAAPPAPGGGGMGGGGGLFGDAGEERDRDRVQDMTPELRLAAVADIVHELIEPEAWDELGGSLVTLREIDERLTPVALQRTAEAELVATKARQFLDEHAAIFGMDENAKVPQVGQPQFPHRKHDGSETVIIAYNVRDLGRAGDVYSLIDVIVEQVEPESWQFLGGSTGVVTVFDAVLFIRTTAEIHGQVQALLAAMRTALELPLDDLLQPLPLPNGKRPLRVYDVRDIAQLAPVQVLVDVIQERVDPDGWVDLGGDVGLMQHFAGLLIIRNTTENHQAIEEVLSQLRR